ncbi:zinc finger protein 395 isoform X1 [Oncorhynchus mykiss]|uniref:Zinc finger protein 395b n=1 Tax=Oncorhynchus mykiss TaxID=8022 RepID=A0A8C7S2N5_ONCMY|nr:zinc finger protein 395 isoform X1 [Oncorhynchus mykiss]XP_036832209.1 zinc finger protein 395 isoform X1 [Oncorhynchus mykiss]
METKRPEDRISSSGPQSCPSTAVRPTDTRQPGAETQETLVYMQCCGQEAPNMTERNGHRKIRDRNHQDPVFVPQGRAERVWTHPSAPQQTTTPTIPSCPVSSPYSFWSPGSVEMDEIMAAMVLTSLSCSPVVQSSPQSQNDSLPGSSSWGGDMECRGGDMECSGGDMECGGGDMECGGGELSDSGSSGYWSWDHGNVSPSPSPSVAEMDSRPDEGLHMELGGELHTAARSKSSFRGTYRCLWPSCGKVLTSSVGMKRHVRVMHLGSGSEQSPREEDFYYTKISCEAPADPSLVSPLPPEPSPDPSPVSPLPPAPLPASSPHVPWASCGSPLSPDPDSGLQITSSGSGSSRPSSGPESAPYQHRPLSQSAPSSSWQIQTDHLYQACTPLQVTMSSCSPAPCCWTPPPLTVSNQHSHHNTQVVTGRCRSVSVGEQWLQQNSATNRLTTLRAASPSGSHCPFRKGRGEAKKCRKVYGVEHKEQWCTACRWKKACQRFTD